VNPVKVIEITGIPEITDTQVLVKVADTGREVKLPSSQVDFAPGRVILPVWLWKKIWGSDGSRDSNR